MAHAIGYPVAMKLVSPDISYKASVVSTQLNINSDHAVNQAWQLIEMRLRTLRPDAEFSGVLIEPMYTPVNPRYLALSIYRDPDVKVYLGAFRHKQALSAKPLGAVLRRLSELACELPEVFSLDINPLVISEEGAMAMDVQVVLERPASQQAYKHLAIHPYPWQWMRNVSLKDKSSIQLRPIRPEDAAALQDMVRKLSAESRYFRFMHTINELSPQMIAQFTKLDYDRQMCFVATTDSLDSPRDAGERQTMIGASRYMITSNRLTAEFAVSVSDESTGKGLATHLMRLLLEHAKSQGLQSIHGDVLRTNKPMQALMKALGFSGVISKEDHEVIIYTYDLTS